VTAIAHPCDLWTVGEVSAAMNGGDFTVQPASSGAPICGYVGTEQAGDLIQNVYAGFTFGDESTGSLLELVRQNLPDAEELDIGGLPAIPGTTDPGAGAAEGWSQSSLYLFPDPMVMIELAATAPAGVDTAAALVALATLAAPRVASLQPPAAAPSPSVTAAASVPPAAASVPPAAASVPPAASSEALLGLAARFPAEIGGNPVSIDRELTGPEFLSQIVDFKPMEQKVTRTLRRRDRKASDLGFAIGSTDSGTLIAAFQVEGGPIKPFVNVLLESLAMERRRGGVRPEDVAGKAAFGITGGFLIGTQGVAYAKDDILWLVFSFGPEQVATFEALP
jgi:hypothetical protein